MTEQRELHQPELGGRVDSIARDLANKAYQPDAAPDNMEAVQRYEAKKGR